MKQNIKEIEERMSVLEERMSALEGTVSDLGGKVGGILELVSSRFKYTTKRLEELNGQVIRINEKLSISPFYSD